MRRRLFIMICSVLLIAGWTVYYIGKHRLPEAPPKNQSRLKDPVVKPPLPPGLYTPKISRVSPQKQMIQVQPKESIKQTASEEIDLIVATGPDNLYVERMDAVYRLGKNLPQDQVKALMQFMATPLGPGTTEVEFRRVATVKNEVLNALLRQNVLPEGIGEQILAMAANPELDSLWRDYCVQHFVPYYQKKYPATLEKDAKDEVRTSFIRSCWDHIKVPGNERTGTALLSLERLSLEYPEFDKKDIGNAALSVAQDPNSPVSSRIPALQIAARMGAEEVASVARALVGSKSTTTLRLSAIATLGEAGGEKDLVLLAGILKGSDKNLHRAASEAMDKIEKRIHQESGKNIGASDGKPPA